MVAAYLENLRTRARSVAVLAGFRRRGDRAIRQVACSPILQRSLNALLTTASRSCCLRDRTSIRNDEARMARTPKLAAGGIVFRAGVKPQIAVVQRRKDNGWVLPKGKLKARESAISAARREASEETGHEVDVHEFLGVISYWASGRPKVVHFWRMQAAEAPGRMLTKDIKALKWLPLTSAIERLSTSHEQAFLQQVGRRAVALVGPQRRRARGARRVAH